MSQLLDIWRDFLWTEPFYQGVLVEIFGSVFEIFFTVIVIGIIVNICKYLSVRSRRAKYAEHLMRHLDDIASKLLKFYQCEHKYENTDEYKNSPRYPDDFFDIDLQLWTYVPFDEVGDKLAFLQYFLNNEYVQDDETHPADILVKEVSTQELNKLKENLKEVCDSINQTQLLFIDDFELREISYTVINHCKSIVNDIYSDHEELSDKTQSRWASGTTCEYDIRKLSKIYYDFKKKLEFANKVGLNWMIIVLIILAPFMFSVSLIDEADELLERIQRTIKAWFTKLVRKLKR